MKYAISSLIIAILLGAAMPASAAGVPAGSLIRGSQPAVYYVTADGKRLAFPNEKTYFTWFSDFKNVKFVSDAQLASYPLAGNVTYRPGTRLLKLSSGTTVYAVSHNGVLRPFQNQNAVLTTFGKGWINFVDDLSDAFFVNYRVGLPIFSATDYSPSAEFAAASSIAANMSELTVTPIASVPLSTASVGPSTVSGRIMSVAIDPLNENVAYVGSASGGVWKTSDMGRNWVPLTDRLASMHIGSLAIDPQNPSVIYAGTGETYMPGDDFAYMGVYLSRDAGATWNLIDSTAHLPLTAVSSIAIDPKNSSRIMISGNMGVYLSTDAGASWKKTLDGFVEQLMVSTADTNTVFATGSQTSLWRSKDGGSTWTKLVGWNAGRGLPDDNPWFNRVTITQSSGKNVTKTPHVIYAVFADPFRVYRSDTEGESWNEVARQTYNEVNYAIAADPNDADIFLTAGNQIRRASEGGWTVKVMTAPYDNTRAIAYAPSNSKVVYGASENGVQISTDGGLTWQARSSGLNTTQWYSLSVSKDGSTIYGAVEDYSMLRKNGSDGSWSRMYWGSARKLVADANDARTVYAISNDSKGVGKSTDNGEAFSSMNGNLPQNAVFTALAVDPVASGMVFVSSGSKVYGTDDFGRNWILFGGNGSSADVTSISVSSQPRRVFVGRADGTIETISFNSSAFGNFSWKTAYHEPNNKPIAELSARLNAVTVAFDTNWGTRVGRLTLANNGWAFSDLTGDLPEGAWLRALAVDPANDNVIYVSHRAGAFRGISSDGKTWKWARTEGGLPAVEVTDIAISATTGRVFYATWGRGLYEVVK